MSLLAVGTLAYDTVETPAGRAEDVLGGAATYFSVAASYFGPVRLVSVVGDDFRPDDREFLQERGILLEGLSERAGKTFRWSGSYLHDLNVAETLDTQLNVLDGYLPDVPASFKDSRNVFLANSPPALQAAVLDQVNGGAFKVMDTMNLWINTAWDDLLAVMKRVDMLICNDQEAEAIAKTGSLIRAGKRLLEMGPRYVIVKKGEHGSFLWSRDGFFYAIPAYPIDRVVDPTGAGDSFAGGVMGYLASVDDVDETHLRRALIYGAVIASYNVEDFSLGRMKQITRADVDARYQEFLRFTAHP